MGLGNSAFRLQDWLRAEQAFRQAAVLATDRAPALNNLALALSEQGRAQEAIQAAEEAVAAGGLFEATARATLSELRGAAAPATNGETGK
jgi:uncharacterized protein HemY